VRAGMRCDANSLHKEPGSRRQASPEESADKDARGPFRLFPVAPCRGVCWEGIPVLQIPPGQQRVQGNRVWLGFGAAGGVSLTVEPATASGPAD
jgi:hypothetical protein